MKATVAIIMGSASDFGIMKDAKELLESFEITVHVEVVSAISNLDIKSQGAAIRYSDLYGSAGANVNFVEQINEVTFSIRTYKRGVEDETLSCGTGVTAVALAMHYIGETEKNLITLNTEGGELQVSFEKNKIG